MTRAWITELWRLVLVVAAGAVAGLLFGGVIPWTLAMLILYAGWHAARLYHFEQWVRSGLSGEPPEWDGIWEELSIALYRLQQRNQRSKRRLISRLSRFQEAAQALPDATVVLNNEGVIEWCNNAATRLLGLYGKRDSGHRLLNLVRNPVLSEYLARGEFSTRIQVPSPVDEQISLSIKVVPYGSDQRLLIARDVTQLQRLESMRRDFVANVSHEMRTPLTVISGYLETLQDDEDPHDIHWRDVLGQMQQQAVRMENLVADLLLLAQLESGDQGSVPQPVDMPALLLTVRVEAVALSGEQEHTLDFDIEDHLWLKGNDKELHSAVSNLVSNAVRYTPAGGRIQVRWSMEGDAARLAVRDSGIGIPAHHIPRLTERFYRVDVARSRHSGGTGLGLAIVKHVLQRHDAHLHIESEPGSGTLIRCDFPQSRVLRKTRVPLSGTG